MNYTKWPAERAKVKIVMMKKERTEDACCVDISNHFSRISSLIYFFEALRHRPRRLGRRNRGIS